MMRVYLAAFQTHLEVERQASPHTIRNYLSDLDQFVRVSQALKGYWLWMSETPQISRPEATEREQPEPPPLGGEDRSRFTDL